jgi:hypothetical protein
MAALAPFAGVESLINQGCAATLANAIASYQGGGPFGVILDSAPTEIFGETLDTATRTCGFDGAHAPGIAEGHTLVIDGTDYRVSGGTVPDETGWLQLKIYPVAA